MPMSAPSRCSEPGCTALAKGGRCDAHKRKPWAGRPPFADRYGMSGSAWAKLSARVLIAEPSCRWCNAPSAVVDHITPVAEGGARTDPLNLQALCLPCHGHKSERERLRASQRARGTR